MKKTTLYLILLLSIGYITSCTRPVKHADSFYNVNSVFSMDPSRIPLIKPIAVKYINSWILNSPFPFKSANGVEDQIAHIYRTDVEKIDVQNGVIMAYSPNINEHAGENYYPWVVIVLDQKIAKSFHSEDEFLRHIQTLNISDPDWVTPSEANEQFKKTGCLRWIPDCD